MQPLKVLAGHGGQAVGRRVGEPRGARLVGQAIFTEILARHRRLVDRDDDDRVQAFILRPNHLAPTYPEALVVKPPRFNAYYDIEDIAPVDAAKWKLELTGKIKESVVRQDGNKKPAYDAIVVGAGHNGLTAGSYLARAGRRVLVATGFNRHI